MKKLVIAGIGAAMTLATGSVFAYPLTIKNNSKTYASTMMIANKCTSDINVPGINGVTPAGGSSSLVAFEVVAVCKGASPCHADVYAGNACQTHIGSGDIDLSTGQVSNVTNDPSAVVTASFDSASDTLTLADSSAK